MWTPPPTIQIIYSFFDVKEIVSFIWALAHTVFGFSWTFTVAESAVHTHTLHISGYEVKKKKNCQDGSKFSPTLLDLCCFPQLRAATAATQLFTSVQTGKRVFIHA